MQYTPTHTTDILPAGKWSIDPTHSRIGFSARHMMVSKVSGEFREFDAEIHVEEDHLQSQLTAEVQMDSIDTGNSDRDNHLRTNDFFDIENHPTMTLVSRSFQPTEGKFLMSADLTIKGITKVVEFEITFEGAGQDPWGGTRAGFSAVTTINRRDWGIEWNAPLEAGGVLVGEKVVIDLDIQLVYDGSSK